MLIDLGGFEAPGLTPACNSSLREAVARGHTCVPTLFAFGLAGCVTTSKHTHTLQKFHNGRNAGGRAGSPRWRSGGSLRLIA